MKSSNQKQTHAVGYMATGFIQTLYFDLEFNYIKGSCEQIVIVPDAPDNWESECCKLIPYVRYEYTRVSKKNPETSRSGQARIDQARDKVKFFASVATTKGPVLRVVRETVVTQLQPNVKAKFNITLTYLEESYGNLSSDPIALSRKTRDMPPHLKGMGRSASKRRDPRSNARRAK